MIQVIIMLIISSHAHNVSLSHLVYLYQFPIQLLLFLLFIFPCVHLRIPQVFDLVLTHETILHSTLDVVDLELLAPLGHELMLVETSIISYRMLLTFMKMIEGKGALIRGTHGHTSASVCHCVCVVMVVK
jgi:hypothetical protein